MNLWIGFKTIFGFLRTNTAKFSDAENVGENTRPQGSETQESAKSASESRPLSGVNWTITKTEKATEILQQEANDNRYGYLWGGWGPFDFDCGHAIIDAWEKAGVPVKSAGATWTGNMPEMFAQCGFKDVTSSINLATGKGLERGDVLINRDNHAAQYIGIGKLVHARSSEGNSVSGDQNGKEFLIQNYFNYPWTHVMRYEEQEEPVPDYSDVDDTQFDIVHPEHRRTFMHLAFGDGLGLPIAQVRAWQALLQCWGFVLDADGEFGLDTENATRRWQQTAQEIGADVEVNGIVDEDDWIEIVRVLV